MTELMLLPQRMIGAIVETSESWGIISFKAREGVAVASAVSMGTIGLRPMAGEWADDHFTRYASTSGEAFWHRARPGLADEGIPLARQGRALPLEKFRESVYGRWTSTPRFAVTIEHDSDSGAAPVVACWAVTSDGARVFPHEVLEDESDLLEPLREGWPLDRLADKHVCVVGLGSIGGAACEALAAYGIRRFTLVDPDRLYGHNFARHRIRRRERGRSKVDAVKDLLQGRDSAVQVTPLDLDVDRDADQARPVIRDSDLVLVCSDGTRSRRVSTHLAFQVGRPVVLACVQHFGAYGEVLRLVPGRTGCLLCNRAALGQALDPEPLGAELDYDLLGGTGIPMTAVAGDLWLMAALAAKAAIATFLEAAGVRSQRLPGDMALVGLRPEPDMAPPFDQVAECGSVAWLATGRSRPECPTCGATPR